jgi:hypothetical protein
LEMNSMSSRSTSFTTMILALACGTGTPHVQYSHSAATTHATSSTGLAGGENGLHGNPPWPPGGIDGGRPGSSCGQPRSEGAEPAPQLCRALLNDCRQLPSSCPGPPGTLPTTTGHPPGSGGKGR